MHPFKLTTRVALLLIAVMAVAGAAGARAAGPTAGDGGASLTMTVPAVSGSTAAPETPAPTEPPPSGPGEPPASGPGEPPASGPSEPAAAEPSASTTTTQTITQIQTSGCVSHCDGTSQTQRASQHNTTVHVVRSPDATDGGSAADPAAAHDGASLSFAHRTVHRVRPGARRATPSVTAPAPATAPSPRDVTQVQLGCLDHCYGATTRDRSGLSLEQIEQLLGRLHVPSLPRPTAATVAHQHTTRQNATQSESSDPGRPNQSESVRQSNRTVQVVIRSRDAGGDGATAPALVNQTAQGIWQLQVGCIFYCTATRQVQRAQQTNVTVHSGTPVTGTTTTTGLIWQVQVGCLAWCYDAVETQSASTADSTIVVPAAGRRTRPVRHGAPAAAAPAANRPEPVLVTKSVSSASVSARTGTRTASVSLAVTQSVDTVETELTTKRPRRAQHRHHAHAPQRPARAARAATAGLSASAATASSTATPTWDLAALALAIVLGSAGLGVARRRGAGVQLTPRSDRRRVVR